MNELFANNDFLASLLENIHRPQYMFQLRPDLSFQIQQNPAPAGLEKNKSGTALIIIKSVSLVWGLAATLCLVCIHRMNQVNSHIGYAIMTDL